MGGYKDQSQVNIYEGALHEPMLKKERDRYLLKAEKEKKTAHYFFTGDYNAITNNCINFASSWVAQIATLDPDPRNSKWVVTEVLRQKASNTADKMEAMAIDASVSAVDKAIIVGDTTVAVAEATVVQVEKTSIVVKEFGNKAISKAKDTASLAAAKADSVAAAAASKAAAMADLAAKSAAIASLVLKEVSETLLKIAQDPRKIHELQDLVSYLPIFYPKQLTSPVRRSSS